MLSINVGPLAFPVMPMVLAAAVGLAIAVARRLAPPEEAPAVEHALAMAALTGLLAARLAHVLAHAPAYLQDPVDILDIRDGGWSEFAGTLGAALWLLQCARRRWALRRALAWGAVAGVLGWGVGGVGVVVLGGATDGPAPDVLLTEAAGGRRVALPALVAGRPTVVNLWATWCGPCREEMPLLAAAQQRERDVRFLFVNQRESAAEVRAYLARAGLELEGLWLDPDGALAAAAGANGLPTTLFIDAQGRRVEAHLGVLNESALRVQLQRLREP